MKKIIKQKNIRQESKTKKFKWHFLIAFALLLGILLGYFITTGLSTGGLAIGSTTSGIQAMKVTLTGTPGDISSYKVTKMESTTLSSRPPLVNKSFRLKVQSKTGDQYGVNTFDITASEIVVTVALKYGAEYDEATNRLMYNGEFTSAPKFVIGRKTN